MARNVRFESCSASSEEFSLTGSFLNGQRGSYSSVSLDRSGSFRDGGESRVFGSSSRGSPTSTGDLPQLSDCLMLDPVKMGDQIYSRSGELRRVLGSSFGCSVEDNSFGTSHSKPLPPVAIEELKRFKTTVRDASIKARGRAKKFADSIHKLNKYGEALNTKKQRSDMLSNERSVGSNFVKMGTQAERYLLAQRLEDKPKNVGLNKRVRSSVAEIRAEGRTNFSSRQPLLMGKDRDMIIDAVEGSDIVEEKIRRLPVGTETWDRKMKRKRSVSAVSTRPIDGDAKPKQVVHHKFKNESALRSSDVHDFRMGSSNGCSGINKDGTTLPVGSNARVTSKNESERVFLSRDLTSALSKERRIAKGNKLSSCEDNAIVSPNSLSKGKVPLAPRSGPAMSGSSSPNLPCTSGALEVSERPPSINKFHSTSGSNNRKRPLPTGSPSMAQWVGQRPQKISRTRRANLVSPVSTHDEVKMSSEGCSPSDLGARATSIGTNGSLLARNDKHFRVKREHVSSPARLSESEESGAGENLESRLKGKGSGSFVADERGVNSVQNAVPSVLFTKKNKVINKEKTGDGVHRQGRSGRGSLVSRVSISPMGEKLDTLAKPPRSTRLASEKNGSKSGRPQKKLSDRKAFNRLGHTSIGSSLDLAGESDDDHEELSKAANLACNASYLACSSSFWKKMEPIFGSVSLLDASYLKQQLKSTQENSESMFRLPGHGKNVLSEVPGKNCWSQALDSGQRERSLEEKLASGDLDNQDRDIDTFEKFDVEMKTEATPFYQKVLSALIAEDETEEFEEKNEGRDMSFQYNRDDFSNETCLPIDVDNTNRMRTESKSESFLGLQIQKQCAINRFSCNGRTNFIRDTSIHNKLSSEDLFQENPGFMHSNKGTFPSFSEYGVDGQLAEYTNASGIFSVDCPYDQMCLEDKLLLELQSIGLYPEKVPALADGEDEAIDQEIVELQKKLCQKVEKKKVHGNKIIKAVEEDRKMDERGLEQVAMDRLVELAYKKQLATRGSSASKCGVTRVSKQVALGFMKRTLTRCRTYEDTGKSCFTEPALQDLIFAAPPHCDAAIKFPPETQNFQLELGISGSFPNRAERHDLHNDKNGSSSFDVGNLNYPSDQDFAKTGPIFNRGKKKEVLLDDVGGTDSSRARSTLGNNQVGGTKGKRSERERDKDMAGRNSVAKVSYASMGNFKGERKMKTKPKLKGTRLQPSGDGFVNKFTETTHPEYHSSIRSSEVVANGSSAKGDTRLMSGGDIPQDSSKEIKEPRDDTNLRLNELDNMELHVANDFCGPEDLSTLLNFDDDGLQDHYSAGLDIPMDDLSEVLL
ncbi:hypothetical protein F2P56_031919 [Juglans regia]|uniref:Uncharacterized protein n=3 Tax=Juglans regia TaxID=51240 RepID=A0A833TG24_JUGRE|nr:uncharacterized protein LOC109013967 isoform X1 [Juglans regia]KAF5446282.1 hypothetical protein F2P56_031919 [Juglans regia]